MRKEDQEIQQVSKSYKENLAANTLDGPPIIKRVMECIHEHLFCRQLAVRWLRDYCNVNGSDFSGKFKFYVGKSPQQYWLGHRVRLAKELLAKEELAEVSILSIALSVGFNSHSAFSMIFKKHMGCSPSEYRVKMLQQNEKKS
ncbi:helix-turn-helix domain-containing protein [Fodinibius halophilus]|uniref:Helix-turn-helix transcriptional regulator n=1 Tax=Fodinibius halophilus TaxID=1736908 RepID=A0A6M1T7B9_9BACT|nr:AraC family transcriptional regulator [Fodinibius halophilus]NGP90097.1 helix-turn-helix transcriptional regulator [Fodinibius halophilus]